MNMKILRATKNIQIQTLNKYLVQILSNFSIIYLNNLFGINFGQQCFSSFLKVNESVKAILLFGVKPSLLAS